MAVTVESFLSRFPEFRPGGRDLIAANIADAELRVGITAWGVKRDLAVMYKAAHQLAISPFGQQAELKAKNGGTVYQTLYESLRAETIIGAQVL